MKINILFVFLISLFIISSCDDDNVSPNDEQDNYVKCVINGKEWISNGTSFGMELGPYRKQLRIMGFKDSDTIEFVLKFLVTDSIRPGNIEFGIDDEKVAIFHHNSYSDTAKSGTLTLTYVDEEFPVEANGTFSIVVKGSDDVIYNIENGKFSSGVK